MPLPRRLWASQIHKAWRQPLLPLSCCSSLLHHSAEGDSWQCAVSGCHSQCRTPQTPWTCTLHPCHPSGCPVSLQWHSQPKLWTVWMQQRSQTSLQEVNCLEAREVINEGDPIAIPLMCGHLDRAMHITVDELEGFWGPGGRRREGICMHLSSFAGFTYWIRVCLWIKLKTRHQVAWLQLPDACQMVVAETTMPEVSVQRESGGRWKGGKYLHRNSFPNKESRAGGSSLRLEGYLVVPNEVHSVLLNAHSEMAMESEV